MAESSQRVRNIVPAGKSGWEVHFAAMARVRAGENIIMASAGDHDFHTPDETVAACVEAVQSGHHGYTELSGTPELRAAMADISTRCTGVETRPEEILATMGGQGALYAAVQGTCDPGDHAVIIDPYYAPYPGTLNASGVSYSIAGATSETGFQPDISEIESAIRPNSKLLVINSPNNPTGALYSRSTLEAIAGLCVEHDLWLLSDEVYWTITGHESHISPRSLPGMAQRTLVVNSMSKSHGMTGWRVGWLTGPSEIIAHLDSHNLITTYGLCDFVSTAASEALRGDFGIEEIAGRYNHRRDVLARALGNGPGFKITGSEAGMYVMVDVRETTGDSEAFAWGLLEAEGLSVMPGESFGAAGAGHVRIALTQPDAVLEEIARRFKRHIATVSGKG